MRRLTLVACCALPAILTGCGKPTASVTATVNADLAKAQAGLQQAMALYGVAKGIAFAAELAQPSLTPTVNSITDLIDPQIARAQVLMAGAATDVPAIEALATQIQGQAAALTVATAPAVKVVAAS